ncbi:MAG: DNA replication/repair protein RecF [Eubacteriales bacterium]|nr:DNA replication/repair protein RecF [Eubacteriales bacterium]
MRIEYLKLFHFRNYERLEWKPNPGTTVIIGKNGSGKTNILEAVHFSCFARSHRTKQDKDLMRIGEPYTSVQVKTERVTGKHDVELKLRHVGKTHKQAYVYGKKTERISEMFGHSTCVLFAPEDLEIIKDSPLERRRFLDMQISQMRYRYLNELTEYHKALKNRNILLKNAQIGMNVDRELDVWEEQMCIQGAEVVRQRQWFLQYLNEVASEIYKDLSPNSKEKFSLNYAGQFKDEDTPYLALERNLKNNRGADIRRATTGFGPHKDDIDFRLNHHLMKEYASQGQMRTAVLSVKLAMIKIIRAEMGDLPVLLLDDVFSELDVRRREALLAHIEGIQSIITCTDKSDIQGAKVDQFLYVENQNGVAHVVEE